MQLDPIGLCTTASLATAILLAAPPAHAQQATSSKRLADVIPQGQTAAAAVLGGGVDYAVPDVRAAAEAAAELGEACTKVINIQVQVEELAAKRKASLAALAAASKEFRAQVRIVVDAEKEPERARTTWSNLASALPPPDPGLRTCHCTGQDRRGRDPGPACNRNATGEADDPGGSGAGRLSARGP